MEAVIFKKLKNPWWRSFVRRSTGGEHGNALRVDLSRFKSLL